MIEIVRFRGTEITEDVIDEDRLLAIQFTLDTGERFDVKIEDAAVTIRALDTCLSVAPKTDNSVHILVRPKPVCPS